MRAARLWLRISAAIVALGLIAGAGLLIRERRAVERDARTVRDALADGRPAWAAGPLERWLKARPDSAEAHALRAEVALAAGDFPTVKSEFNQARDLGLPRDQLDRLQAVWSAKLGMFAEAEPTLTRIWSTTERTDPAVHEALARIFLKTYRLKRAKAVIDRWIVDAPLDGRPYLWLTEIDRRTEVDNPGSWETHYKEALRRDPDLDAARHGLAESLRKVHRNDEAREEYTRYLERHPDDPIALVGSGLNELELGNLSRAGGLLDHALKVAPNDAAALKGRAEVALYSGDLASAGRWLDEAIAIDPFDDGAFYVRSQVRALLGKTEESRADRATFERLKKEQAELLAMRTKLLDHPSDSDTRSKVVSWCFEHGREKDGLEWATAILANDPNHAPTCRILADHYARKPDGAGLANFYRVKAGGGQEN
jgi:tetratricopeptide (TPR) repeat protein